MVKSTIQREADLGVENSIEWLTAKMSECLVEPMSDDVARRLATYSAARRVLSNSVTEQSHKQRQRGSGVLTKELAKQWVDSMENADGTRGGHWTLDQTKQMQAERQIGGSPFAFFVGLNLIYSDFCEVARALNISTVQFYCDMAQAFLHDKDANGTGSEKLLAYYNSIVRQ